MTGKVVEKVTCREKYERKGSKTLEENGFLSGSVRFSREEYEAGIHEKKPSMVRRLSGVGKTIALLDLGAKDNIADSLVKRGCDVTIYPASAKAEEIIEACPDGIMLSNGPGDPKECGAIHQLMALATGADTYKMKYGHRGGNHPVKDLQTGRVYISSQNHGYVVDTDKLDAKIAVPAFVNVNDGTNEGLSYTGKNIFTVQFHPEACPGPQDSGYLFDKFLEMLEGGRG